jgi:signal transduction histidine kinase
MSNKKEVDLLIFDPYQKNKNKLIKIAIANGWSYVHASELISAVELFIISEPKVVITEVFSKAIDIELLRALRRIRSGLVIIKNIDVIENYIIYQKRFGLIFDYFLKDTDEPQIVDSIQKALEYYRYRKSQISTLDHGTASIKEELDWLIWKEQKLIQSKKNFSKNIIESIIHSIFQGMGIGSVIPLVDLIKLSSKKEGDSYKVNAEFLESLYNNIDQLEIMKAKLDKMLSLMEKEYSIETLDGSKVKSVLLSTLGSIEKYRLIKKQSIQMDSIDIPYPIRSNSDYLRIAFKELFINALKFSPDNSVIHITWHRFQDNVRIIIMNPILPLGRGIEGIPPEIEYEVFEPFFKLNNIYDERFFDEDLGFGLGLSLLREGIEKLNGKIHLYNVIDYVTTNTPEKKVVAELSFPIQK